MSLCVNDHVSVHENDHAVVRVFYHVIVLASDHVNDHAIDRGVHVIDRGVHAFYHVSRVSSWRCCWFSSWNFVHHFEMNLCQPH